MKTIKNTFLTILTVLLVNTLFVSCSNDEIATTSDNTQAQNSLLRATNFILKTSANQNNRETNLTASYFNSLIEKLNEIKNDESLLNKNEFKNRTGNLYTEGLFEFIDDIEFVSNFIKTNLINETMTESEKEAIVIQYVENTLFSAYRPEGDYGTCKRRERNCHIQVVAAGVLGHLGCAAVADSATIASFGLTAAASVICHSSVAAAQYAGHDNCYLDFQDCLKS